MLGRRFLMIPLLCAPATVLAVRAGTPLQPSTIAATPAARAHRSAAGPSTAVAADRTEWPSYPMPTGADKVLSIVGVAGVTVPSVSAVEALGGSFRRYETDFRTYTDKQWAADGANWEKGNYYDRAMIYYVWWTRTSRPEYLRRANAMAVDYRTKYLESNQYKATPHWAQLDGVAIHYLLTGDEASKTAVCRTAAFLALAEMGNVGDRNHGYMENRIQGRVLLSLMLASKLGCTRGTLDEQVSQVAGRRGITAGATFRTAAGAALERILATQRPDGAYRWKGSNQCGYNKPFMVGLLNSSLMRYETLVGPDPRILPAIKRSVDYLWSSDWVGSGAGFKYLDGPCTESTQAASPDLNNLVASSFGYVWLRTGDTTYRTRGDAVFAGGVAKAYLAGQKQLNEAYADSWRYLALRGR